MMWGAVLRMAGRHAVNKTIARQVKRGKLNPRLGLTLLRDKRVPFRAKFGACALAIAMMIGLNILEIPAETILMIALPVLGIPINIAWNGLENILGPILLISLLLPYLAPKAIVEKAFLAQDGPVIEVEHYEPATPPKPQPHSV